MYIKTQRSVKEKKIRDPTSQSRLRFWKRKIKPIQERKNNVLIKS